MAESSGKIVSNNANIQLENNITECSDTIKGNKTDEGIFLFISITY